MPRRFISIGSISIVFVSALVVGYFSILRKPVMYGEVFDPPISAAEINATDARGNAFHTKDLRGRVTMLYFGYLNCPLECPLTMAHLKLALDLLGSKARDVQVVMISTDPQRDTPNAMNDFLGRFDPSFLGISGNPDELAKIYRDYKVVVLEGGETHSSFTYVIDRNGKLRLTFVPDSTPEDIAHDLKIILAEN